MSKMHTLLQTLADKGLTIGSVESMTGGLFAAEATAIPGASHAFKGTIVSYSREVKSDLLGIPGFVIDREGVVSDLIARKMAIAGVEKLGVDYCVSITGNAGPEAEPGKAEVGQIYIGLATKDAVWSFGYKLEGNRQEIRETAVEFMIAFALSQFSEEEKK